MSQLTITQALQIALQQHQTGKLVEAKSIYEQILKFQPNQPDAMHLLGVVLAQSGDPVAGAKLVQAAIAIAPDSAQYHESLGNVLRQLGQLDEAIAIFREAIRLNRDLFSAWANLGSAQRLAGRMADATFSLRTALEMSPEGPLAIMMRNELAIALSESGQVDEAIAELNKAIARHPDNPFAHQNLGLILSQRGQLSEAIAEFRRAISIQPAMAEAYGNLGLTLAKLGASADALAALKQATELGAKNDKNWINLANHLIQTGDLDDAESACRQAIDLNPNSAAAHAALANVFRDTARVKESLASFDRAIELEPANPSFHSGRIFARHFYEHHDAQSLYQDASEWDKRHGKPLLPRALKFASTRDPDRQLRIGYISPDFTDHVLALLMLPLFTHHDRQQVELYFYSDVVSPSPTTEKFKACAQQWRSVLGVPDEKVAQMIRDDAIDILVDLTMHMQGNRLRVFARKPAPVQITWCYPGTTGLSAIDYRITDPRLDPPMNSAGMFDAFYSEKSLHLPDTFFCYGPMIDDVPVQRTPALQNGFITFGCVNNFCKVNESVLRVWARVLQSVERSRLLLLSPRGSARTWVEKVFAENGITPDRIEQVSRQPRLKYLELFNRIDISLDTFPYNGHTTSLDSFWMGVPVVTMVGPSVVGRAGLSELTNLSLPDLVAHAAEQFVEIAKKLSANVDELEQLRNGLRARMEASPLMDANRFARAMEAAYRKAWRRCCETSPR